MASAEDTYHAISTSKAYNIPPEKLTLVVDPEHPLFDQRVLLPFSEEGVLKMMAGVFIPSIIIRLNGKNPKTGENIVEVVEGRQRTKDALEANRRLRKLGEETILLNCTPQRGSEDDFIDTMIVANTFGIHLTIMDNAMYAQKLLLRNRTDKEVAERLKCSVSTVGNYKKLLDCCPEVQNAVNKGKIPAEAAKKLHSLEHKEQKRVLAEMIAAGATKGRAATSAAENAARGKSTKPDAQSTRRVRSRAEVEHFQELLAPSPESEDSESEESESDSDSEIFDIGAMFVEWFLGDDEAFNNPAGRAIYKLLTPAHKRVQNGSDTRNSSSKKKNESPKKKKTREVETID